MIIIYFILLIIMIYLEKKDFKNFIKSTKDNEKFYSCKVSWDWINNSSIFNNPIWIHKWKVYVADNFNTYYIRDNREIKNFDWIWKKDILEISEMERKSWDEKIINFYK